MKSRTNSLLMAGFILVCAVLVYSVHAMHASTVALAPGMLPYTPTRLEWLELNLQANFRDEGIRVGETNPDPGAVYSINFIAKPPDTIEIVVQYSKRTRAGLVDKAIEHYRRMVEKDASSRGWSQWLKIEVQRDLDED